MSVQEAHEKLKEKLKEHTALYEELKTLKSRVKELEVDVEIHRNFSIRKNTSAAVRSSEFVV